MLEAATKKIPTCIDRIFISDDNSTDNSENTASKLKISFYKNKYQNGYGGNVKNALNIAFNEFNADYAVEIHGDGAQFHPGATQDALNLIKVHNVDLICGSRFKKFLENIKLGYPLIRMIPNLILSSIERIILNIPITDFHQGFKIYSKNLFKKINLNKLSNNYLFSFEIIIYSKILNLTIKDVPVLCDYKSPHTSHKLFGKNSAFVYQMETFNIIYKYLRKKL